MLTGKFKVDQVSSSPLPSVVLSPVTLLPHEQPNQFLFMAAGNGTVVLNLSREESSKLFDKDGEYQIEVTKVKKEAMKCPKKPKARKASTKRRA